MKLLSLLRSIILEQSSGSIKPGVEELFKNNQELSSIGTPENYSKYLTSVFPQSKMKDIAYHVTKGSFSGNTFNKSSRGSWGEGVYFGSEDVADRFKFNESDSKNVVMLNLKNPLTVSTEKEYWELVDKYGVESSINRYLRMNGYDSAIREEYRGGKEYFVFEPKQIYILGSKEDLEKFKRYIKLKGLKNF